MKIKKLAKWSGAMVAVAGVAVGFGLKYDHNLLSSISEMISPEVEVDLDSGDMHLRKRKKKKVDHKEMNREEREMLSFLDRELKVQRKIASTVTIEFETEETKTKKKPIDRDDPLQIKMVKRPKK